MCFSEKSKKLLVIRHWNLFLICMKLLKKQCSWIWVKKWRFFCSVHPSAVCSTQIFTSINCPSVQPPRFSAEYFWLIWSSFSRLHLHYVPSSLENRSSKWAPSERNVCLLHTDTVLWRFTAKLTGVTSNRHCAACRFLPRQTCVGGSAEHPN